MNNLQFLAYHRKDKKIYRVLHLYWVENHEYIQVPHALLEDNRVNYPRWKVGTDIDLLRSTGLVDKTGEQIFEGDTVRVRVDKYTFIHSNVTYENGMFSIKGNCLLGGNNYIADKVEIIGNVYNCEYMQAVKK